MPTIDKMSTVVIKYWSRVKERPNTKRDKKILDVVNDAVIAFKK